MDQNNYERKLPHWTPPGGTLFLTYRLYGSIPLSVIRAIQNQTEEDKMALLKLLQVPELPAEERYRIQQVYFKRYDDYLDLTPNEPHWLKIPEIAQEIYNSWMFIRSEKVQIHAFTIMSNHVHILLSFYDESKPFFRVMQSHKSFTARKCNKLLGRSGPFWQDESYDHLVRRPGSFQRVMRYIVQNPVKAKYVDHWRKWPWTFVDE